MTSDGRSIRELERKVNELQGFKMHDELGLMPKERPIGEEELSYLNIATALAHRYDSIYYVNLENDHYVEYVSSSSYKELKVETGGDDFFADSARNIRRVVHPDDIQYALHLHDKAFILKELEKENLITFTYRIMFDGEPHFYHGRMTRNLNDPTHLIIGWANVDSQVRREELLEEAQSETYISRSITQALLSDYTRIYYVDIKTEEYIEWTQNQNTLDFVISGEGTEFIRHMQEVVSQTIYPPDREKYFFDLQKESILRQLESGNFACSYRVQDGEKLTWHTLKIIYAAEKSHILVSVRDIDEQKRREAAYENQLLDMSVQMSRDVMTNVKNKFAYLQMEEMLNEKIDRNPRAVSFGVVVCDLNDLKKINDSRGHKAGDRLIIDAAHLISDIFKRSPVFRIGGDEFAVVLTDHDYENREELFRSLLQTQGDPGQGQPVSLASGMSIYDAREDSCFEDVFARADRSMYERKRVFKESVKSLQALK